MKKVLVIAGPTASGKSDFAIACAKRFHGSIISGDSIQVYKGLDIGSGKILEEEMEGVDHTLINIKDPKESYSVSEFQKDARKAIDECEGLPILVGGTGLYLKACLYDYEFLEEEVNDGLEEYFEGFSSQELYKMLQELDPKQAEKIHPNNKRRLIRSLTICKRSGQQQSSIIDNQEKKMVYDAFIVACTMDREILYDRINKRVEKMFEDGLKEEVEALLEDGVRFEDQSMKGIGYREFEPYFNNQATLEEVKEMIQRNSRRYAKRQYTWLNHQIPVHYFEVLDEKDRNRIFTEIETWMNS